MPIIKVEMWEGRALDQKRELTEVPTKETARIIVCAPESIWSGQVNLATTKWFTTPVRQKIKESLSVLI
jgi:hypothetical protein